MNITVNQKALAAALKQAQGIIEKRNSMPILGHALLRFADGRLSVTTTDMELTLTQTLAASGTAGETTAPAKKLFEVVSGLSGQDVQIVADDGKLAISSGRARFSLLALSADDFPAQPETEGLEWFTIRADVLAGMIGMVAFAVSADDTRFNLAGARWESRSGTLRMVATDGHRMSLVDRAIEGLPGSVPDVTVPRKALAALKGLSGDVRLGVSSSFVVAQTEASTLIARTIEGSYPDYTTVIPKTAATTVGLNRESFAAMVRRVAVIADISFHGIGLELSNGQLVATSADPGSGEARETMDVESHGPDLAVGMNARYLVDVCAAMQAETITMEFVDGSNPAVITGDDGFKHVVMPMRV